MEECYFKNKIVTVIENVEYCNKIVQDYAYTKNYT